MLKELREGHMSKCSFNLLTKEHDDFRPPCLNKSSRKEKEGEIRMFWRQPLFCETKARRHVDSQYLGLNSKKKS